MRPPFENTKPTDLAVLPELLDVAVGTTDNSEVDPFLQTKPTDPFGATVPTNVSEQRVEQKINTMPAEQPESLVDQQGIFDRIAFTGSLKEDLTRLPHLVYDMLGATQRMLGAYWAVIADKRAGKQTIPLPSALSNALTHRKDAPYSNETIVSGLGKLIHGAEEYPYMKAEFKRKYPILNTELDFIANVGSDILLSGYIMQGIKVLSPLSRAGKMLNEPTRVTAELTQTRKGEIIPKFKVIRDKYPMKTFESMAMDYRNLDAKEEQARKTAELYTRVAKLNKDKQNIDINLGMADALREQKKTIQSDINKYDANASLLYRGQPKEFTELRKFEDTGKFNDFGFNKGIFTADNIDHAKMYGENIFRFKKPLDAEVFDFSNISDKDLGILGISKLEYDVKKSGKGYENFEVWITNAIRRGITGLDARDYNDAMNVVRGQPQRIPDSYKKMTDFAKLHNITGNSEAEIMVNSMNYARDLTMDKLKTMGYTWWRHNEGGGGNVYVAMSDEALKAIDDLELLKSKKTLEDKQLRTINQVVKGAKQELFTDINKFSQELADTHKEVMDSLLIRKRILVGMQDTVKLDPFSKQHYDQVLKTALSEVEKTKGVDIGRTLSNLERATITEKIINGYKIGNRLHDKIEINDLAKRFGIDIEGFEFPDKTTVADQGLIDGKNIVRVRKSIWDKDKLSNTDMSAIIHEVVHSANEKAKYSKPIDNYIVEIENKILDILSENGKFKDSAIYNDTIKLFNNSRIGAPTSGYMFKDRINSILKQITNIDHYTVKPFLDDLYYRNKNLNNELLSYGTEHYLIHGKDKLNPELSSAIENMLSVELTGKPNSIIQHTQDITRSGGISTLPSADTQLRAINDGVKLTEDLDEVLKTQIKRAVYIEDIKGMIKPKGQLKKAKEYLGGVADKESDLYKSVSREAKLTGTLSRKRIDNMAYRFSDGVVSSYDELPLEQLQSVHGWLKMSDTLPQDMNWVRQFVITNVTPDWYTMEKLGIGQFSRGIDDALHMINRWKESFNKVGNQIIRGYKDTSLSRVQWGEQTDELASYLADNGNDISKVPKDLLDQFNGQQIGYVQDSVAKIKEMTDTAAEMAIKLGYMTRDTETYNRLLETLKTTDEQILALQKSMKGLATKSTERLALRTQLSDLRKARKEVKENIDKYPAIYNPSYYPHKKSLLNNIEQDIRSMEAENAQKVKKGKEVRKAREWSGDVGDFYGKQAFRKNMPLNINPSELMKRTANEDIFSRRFFDVTSTAFTSEMRKIFLEPEIKKGHAFIDAMPRNVTSDVMANTFDRMVRKARGMEMTGDVWANKLFYGMSKGVEKISGGRWHSRERAWEHFTDALRKLTYGGTILGNTVVMTKNFFQVLHTVETIGTASTYAGWESMFTNGGRRILQSLPVMDGRFPMEALDITKKDVWDEINRIGGYGNAFIERYINCSSAGNGAIWKIMTSNQSKMDQLSKFAYSRGYDPKSMGGFRFWDAMADAIEAGLFQDVKDAASMNIKFTQWSYHKHDMSPLLSSSTGKLFFMFQNWTQHYATVFLPQLWRTLLTGESPITDAMGRKYTLTDPERYALLSHISLMAGIAVLGSQLGFNMDWITPVGQIPSGKIGGQTVPFPVSPPVSTAVDVGLWGLSAMRNDDAGVKRAINSIQNYDLPTFIPAGSQARKMQRVIGGEVPPESLILPVEKQQQTGRITTRLSAQRGGQRIYSR